MLRKSSKQSIAGRSTREIGLKDSNQQIFKQIQQTLLNGSKILQYNEFQIFYEQIVKNSIKKSEIQKNEHILLNFLKRLIQTYKPTLQIQIRILILEAYCQINSYPQQSIKIFTKIKHMLIDSELQYLLSKVFLQQAKIYQIDNNNELICKCLLKCISFSQGYVISSFMKHKQEIRKQITEMMIIAYFQLYKAKKQSSWKQAEEYITKAYKISLRNFGSQDFVTQVINQIYSTHKNMRNNIQQQQAKVNIYPSQNKAISQILDNEMKNNMRLVGFYSWQQQKLVAQIIKNKKYQKQIIQQAEFQIKLDYLKVKEFKNVEWVQIGNNNQIVINQDQVFKVLEGNLKKDQTNTTRIGLKTVTRDEIIKRQTLSSSSEDASFIQKEDFNFIRRLGRSQSAKKKQQTR